MSAEQLKIAIKALEDVSDWKFGWDGDCGVTRCADEALAAIEAIAPPVAAGSIDTKMLDSLMMAYASAVVKSRDGNQSEIRGAVVNMLKFFDDSAAQQHAAGYAKKISDAECGALAMLRIERERAEKAEAELETWVHTNRIDELQRELEHKQALVKELEDKVETLEFEISHPGDDA